MRVERHRSQTWVAEIKSRSSRRKLSTFAITSGGRRFTIAVRFLAERIMAKIRTTCCPRTKTFSTGLYLGQNQSAWISHLLRGKIKQDTNFQVSHTSRTQGGRIYLPRHPSSVTTVFVRAKSNCSILRSIPGYAAMTRTGRMNDVCQLDDLD